MAKNNFVRRVLLLFSLIVSQSANAQDKIDDFAGSPDYEGEVRIPCILFPSPMYERRWQHSIGFISTTTPEDVTEEVRVRAPAGDYHVLRKINSNFLIDGRLQFQIVQNHASIGFRYTRQIGYYSYLSVGDDVGFWFGKLNTGGFDSEGKGWVNYPNMSIGFRTNAQLLFTLKAEGIINTYSKFNNGGYEISKDANFFNGYSFTFGIEQPFYHNRHLTLAFTALYSDFYWMMWSLFETFDKKIFYPQITVGFIL